MIIDQGIKTVLERVLIRLTSRQLGPCHGDLLPLDGAGGTGE